MKPVNNFWAVFVIGLALLCALFGKKIHARTIRVPVREDRCVLRLDNRSVAKVGIDVDGTVLDFPTKPTKVILGRKGSFGVEYVQSDLAVSPLGPGVRSHLYVYLEGRRFSFDLSTTTGGCAVIAVRDAKDNQVSIDDFYRPKK